MGKVTDFSWKEPGAETGSGLSTAPWRVRASQVAPHPDHRKASRLGASQRSFRKGRPRLLEMPFLKGRSRVTSIARFLGGSRSHLWSKQSVYTEESKVTFSVTQEEDRGRGLRRSLPSAGAEAASKAPACRSSSRSSPFLTMGTAAPRTCAYFRTYSRAASEPLCDLCVSSLPCLLRFGTML